MDIKTARKMLAAAEDKEPNCTCPSPEDFHEEGCPWLYWMYEIPKATAALAALALPAWAALILAVEALEAVERDIRLAGARRIYVQTESKIGRALAAWEAL